MTQKLFDLAGIGKDRLHLAWVSSAEAQRFADVVTRVTESIVSQGKFDASNFGPQLAAAERTLSGEPLRWIVGKENTITRKGDVYGRKWNTETYESVLDSVLEREFHINLILQAVKDGCGAPRDISAATGLDLGRVSYLLADMEKKSLVAFTGMEACKPVFAAI
jgi:hypothetical protein